MTSSREYFEVADRALNYMIPALPGLAQENLGNHDNLRRSTVRESKMDGGGEVLCL
jgi:hypothetical protein